MYKYKIKRPVLQGRHVKFDTCSSKIIQVIIPRSISAALLRVLASSSKSANRTTSVERVLNRFPSSPRTRPKPTWLALGYCLSSAGSQPARLAACIR
jgi:hypothetical protein